MKREIPKEYLFTNRMLLALILPLVVEQFLAVFVGMADSIMIASVGEAAVSGVSLVDQVMFLFFALFAALGTGGAVIAGQYLGMNRKEKAKEAATQLVWLSVFVGILFMVMIYGGKEFILTKIFGKIEPDVYQNANIYLVIVGISIPFLSLYNAGAAIFRAQGNSEVSMKISLGMNVINVAGNAVMVYLLDMGTKGVAIPTLLSRMFAAITVTILLRKKEYDLTIQKMTQYRPNKDMIKRILHIGIPNGLENASFQLGKILVLSLVSSFGTYSITANAVCNVIASIETLPGVAIGLALTTVIARTVGANDSEQTKFYTKKLMKLAYIFLGLITIGTLLVLPYILKVYHLSPETTKMATQIMWLYSICAMIMWPASFTFPNMLRAAGDVRFTMWVSMASMWLVRIGLSYVFGKWFQLGVFGVWMAMISDWVVRVIFFIWRYVSGKWEGHVCI